MANRDNSQVESNFCAAWNRHTWGKWDHITSDPDASVSIWYNVSSHYFSSRPHRDFYEITAIPRTETDSNSQQVRQKV